MEAVNVRLDKFSPRSYQIPIINALEHDNFNRIICIWPRRSGKDILAFNIMIRAALRRVGIYYYVFPTFSSGRRILWEAITNDGDRVLDYIPHEVEVRRNESSMFIELINGSRISIIGSDNYDKTLVGTNVCGVVFSEYALAKRESWDLAARPILAANNGWAIFVSTPRGKNHLFELYRTAQQNPDNWFTSMLTVDQTKHMSDEAMAIERKEMSEDMLQQEYYCSFDAGAVGCIYDKYINKLRLDGRCSHVPWEADNPVYTAWDLGNDCTAIVFFQLIGSAIHVIDYHENKNQNMHEFIKYVLDKPYRYNGHLFPHDGRNRSWEDKTQFSRVEKARMLGLKDILMIDPPSKEDGIEHVRLTFSKIWINEQPCKALIEALDNYRRKWDATKRMYSDPIHDWASHGADAFKTMCLGYKRLSDRLTPEEIEQRYNKVMYGGQGNISPVFRQPTPYRY